MHYYCYKKIRIFLVIALVFGIIVAILIFFVVGTYIYIYICVCVYVYINLINNTSAKLTPMQDQRLLADSIKI